MIHSARISLTTSILFVALLIIVSGCHSSSGQSEKVGNGESAGTSVQKLTPPGDMGDRITLNEASIRLIDHINYLTAQKQTLEMNFPERVEEALSASGISDVDIAGCGGAGYDSCARCTMTVSGVSVADLV